MSREALERPGQRSGRGLVAGDQQREQLVAQLLVRERVAPLGRALDEHRQDAVAGRVRAVAGDLAVHELVGLRPDRDEAAPRRVPGDVALRGGGEEEDRVAEAEQIAEQLSHPGEHLLVAHPDDEPQDHLQRDGLHTRPQGDRLADGPTAHLRLRDLPDQVRVAAQRLAVEGGQHELALAHVLVLVQQEQRVLAQERREDPAAHATHVKAPRVAGEDLANQLRVREEHHAPVRRDADREHLAVAAPAALQEAVRPGEHRQRLQRGRHRGSWRQRHGRPVSQQSSMSTPGMPIDWE